MTYASSEQLISFETRKKVDIKFRELVVVVVDRLIFLFPSEWFAESRTKGKFLNEEEISFIASVVYVNREPTQSKHGSGDLTIGGAATT